MKRYFWTSSFSIVSYIAGILISGIASQYGIDSYMYMTGELLQLLALTLIISSVIIINNVKATGFFMRYGIIMLLFILIYRVGHGLDENIYIILFVYKIILTSVIAYSIAIKWTLDVKIKTVCMTIYVASGIYISLYDFMVYGIKGYTRMLIIISTGFILTFIMILTSVKLKELQTRSNEEINRDYLTSFAENSADIIFYYKIRPYPRFSFISPACERILGYSPTAFYNDNKLHVEITSEDDRELINEMLSEEGKDSYDEIVEAESKGNERIFLQCIVNKIKEGNKVVACEGIFRDVTQRIESDRQMEENNKSRNLMLSYISHDLRTPITYIIGYAEALQQDVIKDKEERNKALESIYRNGNTLRKMVNDISMLSRLESGRFEYEFEVITCFEFFQLVKDMCLYEFETKKYGASGNDEERQFRYRMEIEPEECELRMLADVDRCKQVISNLVSNAVKATDSNGSIDIVMSIDRRKSMAVLEVKDDGIGMSDEDLRNIFENFYRSPIMKKRRNGTGLGLSIAYQIVRGHRGKIEVESEPGEGSSFIVKFPLFDRMGEMK